jgi:hypothetical protein
MAARLRPDLLDSVSVNSYFNAGRDQREGSIRQRTIDIIG